MNNSEYYVRKLSENESQILRQKLLEIWQFGKYAYWYPLHGDAPPNTVYMAQDELKYADCLAIAKWIQKISGNRIFLLTESEGDFEQDISLDDVDDVEDITTDLNEDVVVDKSLSWMIYGSHENTITFTGKQLVEFIETLFAERKELLCYD